MSPWRAAPARLHVRSVFAVATPSPRPPPITTPSRQLTRLVPPPPGPRLLPPPPAQSALQIASPACQLLRFLPPPPRQLRPHVPPKQFTSPTSLLIRLLPPPPRQLRPPPVFARCSRILQKRDYHSLTASASDKLRLGKMPHILLIKRCITDQSKFCSFKEKFAASVENFSVWLKQALTKLLGSLKDALIQYFQYLKKGFEDRALSLIFNAHLLVGYGGLCWGIETMQANLFQVDSNVKGGLPEDDVAQKLRRAALRVLVVLKKVLMFWSQEGAKEELRNQVAHVKKLDGQFDEIADDTGKLTKEVKLLKKKDGLGGRGIEEG